MKVYLLKFLLLICLVLPTLTGCMVGPDYQRPKTAAETTEGFYNLNGHIQDANHLDDTNGWWKNFGDPVTAELVQQALENNYDLKAAAARVMQARAALAQARGGRMPEISYNLNRDRSKRSFSFGPERFSTISTTFSQDISIAYALDLFGKLKRLERAAWAEELASEANRQAVINSVIATVINARVNIATLQRMLSIARANTISRQSTLEIVERRYRHGLVGPVDVRLARENLAAAEAAEPVIELSLATARHSLDVLLGHRAGSSEQLSQTLADLPDLEPIPVGLPASLLDRRADVQAAELQLKATSEQIGVSIAQLYPDLTLTGSYGFAADELHTIFQDSETEAYSLILHLAQPIFKGGRLRAEVEGAKARHTEAAANYAGVVLTALKEVEDALVSERLRQKQLKYVRVRFHEAQAAEKLSRQRYQRGLETILTILESERRRRIAENELAILKGKIWTTRVNLMLALGGNWDQQ